MSQQNNSPGEGPSSGPVNPEHKETMDKFNQLPPEKQQWIVDQVKQEVAKKEQASQAEVEAVPAETASVEQSVVESPIEENVPTESTPKAVEEIAVEEVAAEETETIQEEPVQNENQTTESTETASVEAEADAEADADALTKELNTPEPEEESQPLVEEEVKSSHLGDEGWSQINPETVARVSQTIRQESGAEPTAQEIEQFFNNHELDTAGNILHEEDMQIREQPAQIQQLPGANSASSTNSYFVGFALAAAVIYYLKKKKFIDEESDTLFIKQTDSRSWKEYLDPRKKRDQDDFDEFDRL